MLVKEKEGTVLIKKKKLITKYFLILEMWQIQTYVPNQDLSQAGLWLSNGIYDTPKSPWGSNKISKLLRERETNQKLKSEIQNFKACEEN